MTGSEWGAEKDSRGGGVAVAAATPRVVATTTPGATEWWEIVGS